MKAIRFAFPTFALLTVVLVALGSSRAADSAWTLPPETAKFKPGPGEPLATTSCLLCHSADYISTQPPVDRTAWKASVTKMREKYGAPISTNSVEALAEYFAKTYGKERVK